MNTMNRTLRLARRDRCRAPRVEPLEGRTLLAGLTVNEFNIPSPNSNTFNITAGGDGNLWFTEQGQSTGELQYQNGKIGRITPQGVITEFADPDATGGPGQIVTAPDGSVWAEDSTNNVLKIAPDGTITTYTMPVPNGQFVTAIGVGPDGNIWVNDSVQYDPPGTLAELVKIVPSTGAMTVVPFPASLVDTSPYYDHIGAGADGNLYLGNFDTDSVAVLTTDGTLVRNVSMTGFPFGNLVTGPDGNVWFTEDVPNGGNPYGLIGRIAPDGTLTEFPVPTSRGAPTGMTLGPDGNLWFTETYANQIAEITTSGQVTEYALPGGTNTSTVS